MDIDKFIKNLNIKPGTYKTILQDKYKEKTQRNIISRKFNKGILFGDLFKTQIPHSVNNKYLYYSPNKNYLIFFVKCNMGCNVYYANKFKETDKSVSLFNCYKLFDNEWKRTLNTNIDKDNIIKVI